MNPKMIEWLYGELPGLVATGVLDEASAAGLRAHYGPLAPRRSGRLAVLIFGILGAVLIGAGVILLLAHNWDDLTRPARAVLSFLPLLLAQGLAFWVLARRPASGAWREGVSAFLFLAIGASISLVAQTYNISGDLPAFLLTWSLLGLPLVYLLDAVVPGLFYLWAITEWTCHVRWTDGYAAGYWLLLAGLVPYAAVLLRAGRYQPRPVVLLWAGCISVAVAAGTTTERVLPGLWIVLYAGLFALMFLAGEFWFGEGEGFWVRPLRHIGAGGVLVLAFLLTFEWPWHEVGWHYHRWALVADKPWRLLPDAVLGGLAPLAAIVLLATTWRRKRPLGLVMGLAPVTAVLGYALASGTHAGMAAGLFDLYLLAAGLWLLATGLRISSRSQTNIGLLAVSALIAARFFDTDLDFLLRGLLFIALGVAFLVTNLILIRRKGAAHV
ncbi:MAG: DUF2157 domain-containing protein [bacterium]|nr:DUF2157 domain-containing protein [bacterium]